MCGTDLDAVVAKVQGIYPPQDLSIYHTGILTDPASVWGSTTEGGHDLSGL